MQFEFTNWSGRRGPTPRVPISQSNSPIVWLEHRWILPGSTSSGAQTRDDKAWGSDFKTRNCDAIEMVVARDQNVSLSILGELDQVVVSAISRNQPRRVDRIG